MERKKKELYILWTVLCIVLIFKLAHLGYGLPYKWTDSEAKIFQFANIMLYDKYFVPEFFMYGSFGMYIQCLLMLMIGGISKLLVGLGFSHQTINDVASSFLTERQINFQVKDAYVYYSVLMGKVIFASANVFASCFVYKILKRITGSFFISMVGLILNSFLLIQFQYGLILRQENLSLLFLAATGYYSILFYEYPTRKNAIVLGVMCALCILSEYALALIILVPVALYFLRGRAVLAQTTDIEVKYNIRSLTCLAVLGMAYHTFIVFAVTNTYVFNSLREFIEGRIGIKWFFAYHYLILICLGMLVLFLRKPRGWMRSLSEIKFIPYYFIYGFLPMTCILNLGLFLRPSRYGYDVFRTILFAYTKGYRNYTISHEQMVPQVFHYLIHEQMGYVFFILMAFSGLLFFNKAIDKEMKKKAGIIFAYVVVFLSFLIFKVTLFNTRRFIAISSLQIVLVSLALFHIYFFLKSKNRMAAFSLVGCIAFGGMFYPHLPKIRNLSQLARLPETRTAAAAWVRHRVGGDDKILIDRALQMDSIDLRRYHLNAEFVHIDEETMAQFERDKKEFSFIITTDRKITNVKFDDIHKTVRKDLVMSHLIYPVVFESVFEQSKFNNDFLLDKYHIVKSFIRERKLGPKASHYDFPSLPRVCIIKNEGSPSTMLNPDVIVLKRKDVK